MAEYLFSSFDPVTTQQWKDRITADLKGRDYDQTLVWESAEGIRVKPFYNSADLEALLEKYNGGTLPEDDRQGGNDWTILTVVDDEDPKKANALALEALMNGAGGIYFDLKGRSISRAAAAEMINGIHLPAASVCFTGYTGFPDVQGLGGEQGCLVALPDALLDALRNSTYPENEFWKDTWPAYKSTTSPQEAFTVDGFVFKDAGADILQELAYSLGVANEYLNREGCAGIVRFRMGLSGNFFFEIAKLRALRRLWEVLSSQFGEKARPLHIESRSSVINKSLLDQHTNMLRNTAEAMAGAIGGADSILLLPHDALSGSSSEARRWARNISLVLKHEAYLNKVSDPAQGSYYIESLTHELCEGAWKLFKTLESKGGFIKAYQSGEIKAAIRDSLSAQVTDLAFRDSTLIGVNNYTNESDRIEAFHDLAAVKRDLAPVRPAAQFEALRAASQKYFKEAVTLPIAYLVTAGKPSVSKARVNYTSNFLGCAGISTLESDTGGDLDADTALISSGNYCAVVICSDNESWPELLAGLKKRIRIPIILAGDPSGLPNELQGIPDHAIYMGCDLLETLSKIQKSIFS